ncbi:hypothetical protein [Exiguobacterium sp. s130]|uniref:hypothetical protein n=1 Tax=Exiguobacterium sp. s130 TaxID=2751190 RepID=UPI001BE7A0FC|nr:hypothetical protein [Exiguobacterium sp. s130]
MYKEYRYPAFLRGLIVSELPVIIDHAILRTISKYGSLVNNPRTCLEHLMIFSSYMSFAIDEVGDHPRRRCEGRHAEGTSLRFSSDDDQPGICRVSS